MFANRVVRRVLLIEHDDVMATSLATLLEATGYEVEAIADGEGALELAQQFKPDVCLIDDNIPGLSGCELARLLRGELREPPLLANITPFSERDDWDSDAEFDLDFTKPSDPALIVTQLVEYLESDRLWLKPCSARQPAPRMPTFRRDSSRAYGYV